MKTKTNINKAVEKQRIIREKLKELGKKIAEERKNPQQSGGKQTVEQKE